MGGGNVQEQGQEPLVHHAGVAEVVVGLVLLPRFIPKRGKKNGWGVKGEMHGIDKREVEGRVKLEEGLHKNNFR